MSDMNKNGVNDEAAGPRMTAMVVRDPEPTTAQRGLSLVPSQQDLDNLVRMGKIFNESGLFKDVKSVAQAVVKVMAGLELGLPAMVSMRTIHVFQGQTTLSSSLIAGMIKDSAPRYDWGMGEETAELCEIKFFENGKFVGIGRFTWQEAQAAGLATKDNWKAYRSDMLFARAMSRGARRFCSSLFRGPIYTPEELREAPPEEMGMIDVTPRTSRASAVAEEPEDILGHSSAGAPVVDYSPIGEVVEGARPSPADSEFGALSGEEEEAEALRQAGRVNGEAERLKLKYEDRRKLYRTVFGRSDMSGVSSTKLRSLADDLERVTNPKDVARFISEFEERVKAANSAHSGGEGDTNDPLFEGE